MLGVGWGQRQQEQEKRKSTLKIFPNIYLQGGQIVKTHLFLMAHQLKPKLFKNLLYTHRLSAYGHMGWRVFL